MLAPSVDLLSEKCGAEKVDENEVEEEVG